MVSADEDPAIAASRLRKIELGVLAAFGLCVTVLMLGSSQSIRERGLADVAEGFGTVNWLALTLGVVAVLVPHSPFRRRIALRILALVALLGSVVWFTAVLTATALWFAGS